MWESLLALTLHFLFCENRFCMQLGFGIVAVWASQSHGGINNSDLMLSLEGVRKFTH
jgi:hypothetical protein